MEIKDKFFRMVCSLIPIFQVVGAQLSNMMSPNSGVTVAEPNTVVKSKVGPFASVDDRLYSTNYYLKLIKNRNKNLDGRVIELKHWKPPEKKKIDPQEKFSFTKIRKGSTEVEKRNSQLDWNQSNQPLSHLVDRSSPELSGVLKQINDIYNQIKLKTLWNFFANLKAELNEVERTLTLDPSEKFFELLEEILVDTESNNKIRMASRNRYKGINNKAYKIQNQIKNMFIFNLLLAEDNSKQKEKDIEIFNKLSDRKMNELLEKAVNNLNEKKILQGDVPAVTQVLPQNNQIDFLKQLQKNFSRMFHSQNVTLNHINQISKIIDFVERYHGIVSDLKTLSTVESDENRENRNVIIGASKEFSKEPRAENKILCDDEFDYV